MSKKTKKKPQKQVLLSPENYVKQKARNLPIVECFITPKWEDCGECNILIVRQHVNGNYTLGFYLIDTYCLGIKDAGYKFNIDESEYADLKEHFDNNFEPTTYNEAHNIIYGALEYAETLGFRPHKDFSVAKYILEEDTDDIPLIEYEFGCDGKPLLIVNTHAELNRYLPTLRNAVGDDYDLFVKEDDDYDDYDDEDEEDEDEDEDEDVHEFTKKIKELFDNLPDNEKADFLEKLENFHKRIEKNNLLPSTPYNYKYPEYPQKLDLTHKELEALFDPKNNDKLDKKTLDTILALPRETLIKDLELCLLYEIGQNCCEISKKNDDNCLYGSITHALYLLAEVKATESLPIVLEVLRQSEEFERFFFSDFAADTIIPVLYKLAKDQLPVLLAYLKEPNLQVSFKSMASSVFAMVLRFDTERRSEIVALYEDILDFLYENIHDTNYYDGEFAGMLIIDPTNLCIVELLPKIKRLFDTNLVDEMACGDYNEVEKDMTLGIIYTDSMPEIKSIYEIYD